MKPYGTDANGKFPQVGDFVAYNYSGQIATGWIISTGKTGRTYSRNTYKIQQVAPKEGHISRVRGGAMCVLVLEDGGGLVKEIFAPDIDKTNNS